MKSITTLLNEAKQEEYRVSFLGCKDEEGLPITVSIMVDKEDIKTFEKYLEKEQDNIFMHADGGSVEY